MLSRLKNRSKIAYISKLKWQQKWREDFLKCHKEIRSDDANNESLTNRVPYPLPYKGFAGIIPDYSYGEELDPNFSENELKTEETKKPENITTFEKNEVVNRNKIINVDKCLVFTKKCFLCKQKYADSKCIKNLEKEMVLIQKKLKELVYLLKEREKISKLLEKLVLYCVSNKKRKHVSSVRNDSISQTKSAATETVHRVLEFTKDIKMQYFNFGFSTDSLNNSSSNINNCQEEFSEDATGNELTIKNLKLIHNTNDFQDNSSYSTSKNQEDLITKNMNLNTTSSGKDLVQSETTDINNSSLPHARFDLNNSQNYAVKFPVHDMQSIRLKTLKHKRSLNSIFAINGRLKSNVKQTYSTPILVSSKSFMVLEQTKKRYLNIYRRMDSRTSNKSQLNLIKAAKKKKSENAIVLKQSNMELNTESYEKNVSSLMKKTSKAMVDVLTNKKANLYNNQKYDNDLVCKLVKSLDTSNLFANKLLALETSASVSSFKDVKHSYIHMKKHVPIKYKVNFSRSQPNLKESAIKRVVIYTSLPDIRQEYVNTDLSNVGIGRTSSKESLGRKIFTITSLIENEINSSSILSNNITKPCNSFKLIDKLHSNISTTNEAQKVATELPLEVGIRRALSKEKCSRDIPTDTSLIENEITLNSGLSNNIIGPCNSSKLIDELQSDISTTNEAQVVAIELPLEVGIEGASLEENWSSDILTYTSMIENDIVSSTVLSDNILVPCNTAKLSDKLHFNINTTDEASESSIPQNKLEIKSASQTYNSFTSDRSEKYSDELLEKGEEKISISDKIKKFNQCATGDGDILTKGKPCADKNQKQKQENTDHIKIGRVSVLNYIKQFEQIVDSKYPKSTEGRKKKIL